ncbi:MAG TPA: DNA mismatch repair endonuclease MutL, partial [Dehalococcoidia bacterium]|nr:DNA mismatch repair endonuclease MutL [Dehalococcoidia bacterium]
DNGCGIDPGELRVAFERHATSKVRGEDDLWRVATLGFRGEALPSVAAAGEVEMITRVAGNDVGARLRLRGGAIVEEGSGATPPGTSIAVRSLFSAQPARLKFLRAPGGESTQVSTVITHYAMAYPEVQFVLSVDGRVTLQTPGNGSLIDAVAAVYGTDVAESAIEVDAPPQHEGDIGVRGVVADPRMHRASRNYIGLYVNRRWVRNRALTFAVEEAYQGMLPVGRHPIAVLDLRIPHDEVDVNVHPTKAEVRLRREREVFGVLQRAVRRALSDRSPVPSASSSLWSGGGASSAEPAPPAFILRQPPVQARLPRPEIDDRASAAAQTPSPPMVDRLPMLRAVGQVGSTYVIAEGPDGMYLVDQHAAHERVMYERFLASVTAGAPDVQGLLEPITVELSAAHQALINEHANAMSDLGFAIDHFGDAAYVVRAVPSPLAGDDVPKRIVELLDRMQRDDGLSGGAQDASRDPSHRVAASLACHAAVRAGMAMSAEEQRELLRQLERAESPRTCPHGRPTMVHLAADAIAREFRRR